MGENLVAGILKNIETLASINANQNISILTGIKKTNTLLSDQIGKELTKQSKLLTEISTTLTRTLFLNLRANNLAKKSLETELSGSKKIKAPKVEKKGKSPLFGDSISNELAKQTSLLESMVSILLKGLKQKGKKEGKSKGFGAKSVLAVFAGMAKMLKKNAPKRISALAKAIQGLTKSIKGFVKVINKIKTKKLEAFMQILNIGKKIFLFAFFFALAAPLLIIGLVVTLPLLFMIFAFFDLVSRTDKGIRSGIKTLMFMAISIGILAFVIAFTIATMGGPLETLAAFGIITLSIGVLAFGLFLVGKIKGDIIEGSLAMLLASVAILVLSFAVSVFSSANVEIGDVLLLGLTIAIVGVAMGIAGAGPNPGFIAAGAGAMILAGVSVLIIATAMAVWSAAKIDMGDVGILGATILMIGLEYAAAGFGALFIGAGAAVMLPVALSLIMITGALKTFSEANWEKGDNKILSDTITGIVTTFKTVFSSISFKEGLKMLAGAKLLGDIGSALSELAAGLSDFANGQAPIFKDGKVVGVKGFDKDLGTKVGETIKAMLTPLVGAKLDGSDSILGKLGAGQGLFFDGPIGNGIDLLGQLGNALGDFAEGVQAFADFKIPIFGDAKKPTKVTGYKKLDADFAEKIGINLQSMIDALVKPIESLGKQDAGFFSNSDYEDGVELLGNLGGPLESLAKAAETFGKNKFDSEKIKTNLTSSIGAFVKSLSETELKTIDTDKAEDVIELFGDFTEAAEKLGKAGGAEGMGKMFIDMKESINSINLSKLTKLNSFAENLAKFAEEMNGNFGDLENVLEKLKDAIAEMNEGGAKITETDKSKDTTTAPVASGAETPMDLTPILEELEEITTVLRGGIDVTATNDSIFG